MRVPVCDGIVAGVQRRVTVTPPTRGFGSPFSSCADLAVRGIGEADGVAASDSIEIASPA
jgi:hypothetical protein